jgi:hypothetical protein
MPFPHPMPYYEFYCPDNHRIYTFFARSLAFADKTPRCPDNPAWALHKRVSRFAFVGRAKEPKADAGDDLADDPRMEAAMAEMEREMAGMDEENPDPRQLARLMRRMGDLTGEPMDEPMKEMIARLEAGEDPDALEDKFGDVFDESGDPGMGGPPGPGGEPKEQNLRPWRRLLRRQAPVRDSRVFEMAEWV